MPALVKSRVGSSAGMREDEGTRRWPRSSKYLRNLSRTWVDFIGAFHDLRNLVRRETPPKQRAPDPHAAFLERQARMRPFEPVKHSCQRFRFLGGSSLLENFRDRVPGEPANRELPFDAAAPVSARPAADGCPRCGKVVEPSFASESVERPGHRRAGIAARFER